MKQIKDSQDAYKYGQKVMVEDDDFIVEAYLYNDRVFVHDVHKKDETYVQEEQVSQREGKGGVSPTGAANCS